MEGYRELQSRSALYGAPSSRVPAAVDSNAARYQHSLLSHSTGAPLATLRAAAAAAAPALPAPRPAPAATYSALGRYAGAPAVSSSSSSSSSSLSSFARLQASVAATSRSAATSLPTATARAEAAASAAADSRFRAPAPAGLPSRLPTPAAPAPALRPPSQQPAYSAASYYLSRDRTEEEQEEEEYEYEGDVELPSSGSVFLASPPPQQQPPRAPLGAAAARTALESQLDRLGRPAAAAGYSTSYAAGSAQPAQHRSAPGPALASAASSSGGGGSSSSGYSSRSSSVGAAASAAASSAAAAPGATTAGLQNLGNTCYMNSTLQCLAHIAPLAAFFSASDWQAELAPAASPRARLVHALAVSFARLLADLRAAPGRYVTPTELRRLAGSALSEDHLFSGSAQNDAHELLRFFLDALREALNRCRGRPAYRELAEDPRAPDAVLAERYWRSYQERDSSVVGDIFRGQLRSVMTCGTCGYSSRSFEPFEELMLQLGRGGQAAGRGSGGSGGGGGEEPTRIEALLEAFVQPETLSGEEAWRCEACKCPRASTKRIAIFKAPPVLILVLKRFAYTRLRRCKVETPVCIAPREPRAGLQLGAYMCDSSEDARGAVYDLVGCINHSGGTFGGHYTADARAGARGWYRFNDAHASATGDVGASSEAKREPYVLFYEKRK